MNNFYNKKQPNGPYYSIFFFIFNIFYYKVYQDLLLTRFSYFAIRKLFYTIAYTIFIVLITISLSFKFGSSNSFYFYKNCFGINQIENDEQKQEYFNINIKDNNERRILTKYKNIWNNFFSIPIICKEIKNIIPNNQQDNENIENYNEKDDDQDKDNIEKNNEQFNEIIELKFTKGYTWAFKIFIISLFIIPIIEILINLKEKFENNKKKNKYKKNNKKK